MESPLCLIMLGGEAPGPLAEQALSTLLEEYPYVIAADRGAEHLLQMGLMPQLVVGDGDSLSEKAREACQRAQVNWLSLPQKKDLTDGEAALSAAVEAGYRRIAVFGAFGGRPDHLLGNLLLPLAYRAAWDSLIFYGEGFTAYYCFGNHLLTGQPGDTISLVPLSINVESITLQGFQYPLAGRNTVLGSSLCLRNELAAKTARITFDNGIMLIIHYKGQANGLTGEDQS